MSLGGSAPAGNTTTTTVNPTAQAQLPFLQDYWSGLKTAYTDNPQSYYPGQTLADYRPANDQLTQGYSNLANTGLSLDDSLRPTANNAWNTLATGGAGYQASPAYGGYNAFATGQTGPQQQYDAIGQAALNSPYPGAIAQYAPQVAGYGAQAAGPNVGTNALGRAAQGQGMGLNALARTASGAYLNSNPYLDATYRAAADPVTRSYQTATAPTTDAAFSGGGRYGSGAAAGARDTNELNLGKTLGDLSTNIYGQNYARERAAQDAAAGNYTTLTNQAANAYGTLANQGLDTAIRGGVAAGGLQNAAGNQSIAGQTLGLTAAQQQALGQQYGLSGLGNAFNTGNQALNNAASLYPSIANAQLIGPNAQIAGGQGLTNVDQSYRTYQQDTINDVMKRYNANQAQPWTNLERYGQDLGAAVPGSSNTTSPYFQNDLANALSGITGATGVAKNLFGTGGLLAGAAAPAAFGTLADASIAAGGPPLAAGLASTAGLTGLPEVAALAAPAFTVICTELVRQGRMPNRWRLASVRNFATYPEIARRGYHVWAIPSVRHMRRKPDSLYSRLLATAFLWRAEDIAARAGIKGARKLWRGRVVTAAMVLPCLICGALCRSPDWRALYREEAA